MERFGRGLAHHGAGILLTKIVLSKLSISAFSNLTYYSRIKNQVSSSKFRIKSPKSSKVQKKPVFVSLSKKQVVSWLGFDPVQGASHWRPLKYHPVMGVGIQDGK